MMPGLYGQLLDGWQGGGAAGDQVVDAQQYRGQDGDMQQACKPSAQEATFLVVAWCTSQVAGKKNVRQRLQQQ